MTFFTKIIISLGLYLSHNLLLSLYSFILIPHYTIPFITGIASKSQQLSSKGSEARQFFYLFIEESTVISANAHRVPMHTMVTVWLWIANIW